MSARSVACVLLVSSLTACGAARTAAPSVPIAQFPEEAQWLAAVESTPAPDLAALVPRNVHHVERWELAAAPAPGDPVYEPSGALDAMVDEVAAQRGVALTRSASLRCAAQEVARFVATHGGMPTSELRHWICAACGSSTLRVDFASTVGTIRGDASEARVVALAGPQFREMLAEHLSAGSVGVGLSIVGAQAALVLAKGSPQLALEPSGLPGPDGLVVVRGRLLEPADAVVAYATQGAMGAAPCRVTPGIVLPDVEVRCPMAESDATAALTIATMRLGRVLFRPVASTFLRRTADARPIFDATPIEAPASMSGASGAAAVLLESLNAARSRAGLAPVELAREQSAVHQRVAPHLLAALLQHTELSEASELLALGLLAGHEVRAGTIRWGGIAAHVALGTSDPPTWLAQALAHPTTRFTLMDSRARQVAVGAVAIDDPPMIGFVVSPYSFFEGEDHAAAAERFFERITEARLARGLPPPRRLEGLSYMRAYAAAVSAGQLSAAAAMQAGVDAEAEAAQTSMRVSAVETVTPEETPIPEEFLRDRELRLGVVAAHTRAPGGAWGQYVFFVLTR